MKPTPLIINVRGNSGSGKTYLTRQFMATGKIHSAPEEPDVFMYWKDTRWYILGRYTNTCGGCDTIKTQVEIIERVQRYTKMGANVWLEGLIMSTIYGTVGGYSERFGDRWVFAYLQPPIDVCLSRIYQRREEAGNTKPLNEANTRARVHSIESSRLKCIDRGRRVVDLDWHKPLPQLLKIIRKEAA